MAWRESYQRVAEVFGLPSLDEFVDSALDFYHREDIESEWESAVFDTVNSIAGECGLYFADARGKRFMFEIMPVHGVTWRDVAVELAHIVSGYTGVDKKVPNTESGAQKFVREHWHFLAMYHKVYGGPSPRDLFYRSLKGL